MRIVMMMVAILFSPLVALAHAPNDCPICACTLSQRDPNWAALHDAWWNEYHGIQRQVVDYARCIGEVNALEAVLRLPLSAPNEVILNYEQGIQHPVEDFPNDTNWAGFQLDAAHVTLGQFYGEALACSGRLDALRLEAARRIKLRKR